MKRIIESSLSRIIQHIENRDFIALSAYDKDLPDDENLKRHIQLMKDVRSMGYGFIEMKAGYTYQDTDIIIHEKSVFIPNMSLEEGLRLGNDYNQETIISKNGDIFAIYYCNNGKIDMRFKVKRDPNGNITFDKDTIKYAFSQLIRANKSQRVKFAYIAESVDHGWAYAMGVAARGEQPKQEWKHIL